MSLSVEKITITFFGLSLKILLPVQTKIKEFEFEDHSIDRKLSINTLMGEIKPIDMGKYEFEYRDISRSISFFGLFEI